MTTESSATALPASIHRRESWLAIVTPRAITALFLLWLLSRWIFDAMWNLVPDEAYYWVWSQHPALSYFDHPPVVAWLIRLGTLFLDNTELGVRCLFGVITGGSVLLLWRATRQITGDVRAASFVPVALFLSPMIAVTGTIAAPDAPACFFQSAALATVLSIFLSSARSNLRWLMFGICMGLALDSKYTSILLGLSVALAMLSSAEGRRQFLTPGPWLAVLTAAIVFSPVIYWNATHHWASFQFQLHHGTTGTSPAWKNLLNYVGGQLGVCTPILFILCIAVLSAYWRRKNNSMPVRILLFSATVPLLFFALSATRRRVEGNWPMFAYFPAVMLVAQYLAEKWLRPRLFWAELAIVVAACMTVVLHAPTLVWKFAPSLGAAQWDHLYGWRDLAQREVEPLRLDSPVFTSDYEYASELSFYLPAHTLVRPFSDPTRPTAFDFFSDSVSPDTFGRVLLVRRLPKGYDAPPFWPAMGSQYIYSTIKDPSQLKEGRQIRRSLIEIAERVQP